MFFFFLSLVDHLAMLSVLSLYIIDRIINKSGAVGGVKGGRRNQNTWRRQAPTPRCLPQITQDLTWD
jgi:hypothetical protein